MWLPPPGVCRRAVLLSLIRRQGNRMGEAQVVLLSVLCHQVARMRLVQVALLSLLGQLFSVSQSSSGSPVWKDWVASLPANGSASCTRSALPQKSQTRT